MASKINTIVGNDSNPTKLEAGQTIINKKATKQNLDKLIEINGGTSNPKTTTDGTDGGLLKGKPHYDSNGKPTGGIPAVVEGGNRVELEGDEFVVSKEASKKHWKELSKINQSAGNGVPINPPAGAEEDIDTDEFEKGGKIEFNPNKLPNKNILNYALRIKEKYPKVWDLGGNIFGNEAFKNLKRVSERGYWLDSEEWMYKKWRAFVARHKGDFRIAGVIAMLKWVDSVDKGWAYMKELIEQEIAKKYPKNKMSKGGGVLLAPNGKQSNLTPEQYRLVRTPEFKAWFGDWENDPANASKVVDENGEPLVVYHGTAKNFTIFNKADKFREDWGVRDYGMYFSSSYRTAEEYSFEKVEENKEYLDWNNELDELKNKQDWDGWKVLYEYGVDKFKPTPKPTFRRKGRVLKCFLSIKKPFVKDANGRHWFTALKNVIDYSLSSNDGVILLNMIEVFKDVQNTYIIFEPNQIKLADGTNTNFDSSNPDIRYAGGGELEKGIATEREHYNTLEDLYKHKITPKEAIMLTAKDHLAENPHYYTELEKIETMAQGGNAGGFKYPTPFGKPSKLTFAQQSLVRTQAFKEWFGDWETAGKDYIKNAKPKDNVLTYEAYKNVSKVIDVETGEPRVMFHGTKAEKEFFVFNTNADGTRRPYGYFAYNKEYSENFFNDGEGHLYNCFLNVKNPFNANGTNFRAVRRDGAYWISNIAMKIVVQEKGDNLTEEEVQQAYLEIIGDMTFNSKVAQYLAQAYEGSKSFVPFWYAMSRDGAGIFKDFLKSRGFDGIFYSEEFSSDYDIDNSAEFTDAFTIFEPKQVKLADGRNTDFDQNKADIRYKKGGKIDMHHEHKNTSNMNRKERLASIIFADKFEEGGNVQEENYVPSIKEINTPPIAKTKQELDKEFVNNLIKKMNN